jgi:hypothetical protein
MRRVISCKPGRTSYFYVKKTRGDADGTRRERPRARVRRRGTGMASLGLNGAHARSTPHHASNAPHVACQVWVYIEAETSLRCWCVEELPVGLPRYYAIFSRIVLLYGLSPRCVPFVNEQPGS